MQISFQVSIFTTFACIPRSGISDSCGSSIFHLFEDPLYCFPWWLYKFTIPPTVYRIPYSPNPYQPLLSLIIFYNYQSNRDEVISHGGLICISPMTSDVEHHFMYLLAFCIYSLEKNLFKFLLVFKLCFYLYFDFELYEFFICFRINPLIRYVVCKYFFSYFVGCLSPFVYGFLY